MIHSDVGAQQRTDEARRLLGCSVRPLSALGSGIQGAVDRIAFLLDWLVGVARGTSGVVLLDGGDRERLSIRARVGLEDGAIRTTPSSVDAMSFGLIVHGTAFDGEGTEEGRPDVTGCHGVDGQVERGEIERGEVARPEGCGHGVVDEASRMTICRTTTSP